MIVYKDIERFNAINPVITIGTFDGIHLGHRKVIDELNRIAKEIKGESVIFTFYPHPRLVISKNDSKLRLISTLDEKIELLEKAGIDHLIIFPFTLEFAALTYIEFAQNILLNKLKLNTLVVGHDHKLGKNREGSFENLVVLSKELNFNVKKIDTFLFDEISISSSKIRKGLQQGDVEKVQKYLGYTYSLSGFVTEGNQIGRSIGFPTANIVSNDPHKLIPAEGVYAITIEVEGKTHKAMLNIGNRPTVNSNADHRTIEAYIFDFNKNIYAQEVRIYFHRRIRSEQKFDSIDKLKAQLSNDRKVIQAILENIPL